MLTQSRLTNPKAPFIPAAMYLLSIFYTRKELATRLALLIAGGVLSTAFAGLLALAVFNLGGTAGLEGWRWYVDQHSLRNNRTS
jgi:MFS family permease